MTDTMGLGSVLFDTAKLSAVIGAAVFLTVAVFAGRRRSQGMLGLAVAATMVAGLAAWIGGGTVAAAALGFGVVCAHAFFRRPSAVGPLAIAAAAAYFAGNLALLLVPDPQAGRLPETPFTAYEGPPVVLAERGGRPVVINLWATWCPPCRREMPMMMEVAQDTPEVDLVFVNQGEASPRIARFLEIADLDGKDVVLDPDESLMARLGAFGLPTTLFFDANGDLVQLHSGEIAREDLLAGIAQIKTP